jgi:hypothetical protein
MSFSVVFAICNQFYIHGLCVAQLNHNDFSDYVEFASENYGDGNLADTNNNNLGNTPAERQRSGLVLILGSWLSIAWLVSCPRVVAKSLVLLRLASFR